MAKKIKKKRRLTGELRGKLYVTYGVIICLFLLLIGRIIIWNVSNGKKYGTTVLGQKANSSSIIPYERGIIYDRNGNMLAGNEKYYTLILEPKNIYTGSEKDQKKYLTATVEMVNLYFGVDKATIKEAIENNKDSYYVILKSDLNYKEVDEFEQFLELANEKIKKSDSEERKTQIKAARNVRGVSFEENYRRIYPYGSLACRLLGYTSSGNVGNWGIEQYYNSTLNGTNGRSYSYFDQELVQEETVKEAVNGNSVVSTIDLQIQQVIEEKLKEFDDTIGSEGTNIVVMDPNNGEILGMASSDPYDLNDPSNEDYLKYKYSDSEIASMKKYTEEVLEKEEAGETVEEDEDKMTTWEALSTIWRNPVISDTYEPGSTYKPFTVSAGLESGVLTGNEEFDCTGSLKESGRVIGCSHVHGTISLKNSIAQSCNVAMMEIATKKEKANDFYYYQNLFGFGLKTGIDLPGEADTSGLVYDASNYKAASTLATNSFGQNFNCTMIQMISGFASLINGGYYYKPHVVKEIQNSNGDIVETEDKELLRQTISASTSKKIREYMQETVKTGTGTKAQITGYSIGGKTGTAEKLPRDKKNYYISFMGFTPVSSPKVLIYVTIDQPNIDDQANARLAVGLERVCMKEIVDILGIEPDTDEKSSVTGSYLTEYVKQKKKSAKKKASSTKATTESTQAADTAAATEAAPATDTQAATDTTQAADSSQATDTQAATEAVQGTTAAPSQ